MVELNILTRTSSSVRKWLNNFQLLIVKTLKCRDNFLFFMVLLSNNFFNLFIRQYIVDLKKGHFSMYSAHGKHEPWLEGPLCVY